MKTGKIDVNQIVKKASREFFMDGMDTRTKLVPSKKNYKRKVKHSKRVDHQQ
jgi:hypothetical protein